jgi:hydroxymethylbilane synthase
VQPPVKIGTRASRLAETQCRWVQRKIAAALGADPAEADRVAPLVFITTTGDRVQDRRLLEIGGKQLFTKEIEEALLDGRVDVAVHSMKDVPAEQPPGLTIAAIPEREDPRDAFLSRKWASLAELPEDARLGTASLRRQAQVLAGRSDLEILMLRGNVDTRLRKLDADEFDAILLAAAGLNRLELSDRISSFLDPVENPPAPGQGALALQCRVENAGAEWLKQLHHAETAIAVAAERGAMSALEGSCRTAIGAHARIEGGMLKLSVEALTPDGRTRWRRDAEVALSAGAPEDEARTLGLALGAQIRAEAGDRLKV